MDGKGQIKSVRVPYDMDFMVDGGCHGTDLWADPFGDDLRLLAAGDGSAYICPGKPDAAWRLFIDRDGRESRLSGARGEQGSPWHPGVWPNFAEIRSCGEESSSGLRGMRLPAQGARELPEVARLERSIGDAEPIVGGWRVTSNGGELCLVVDEDERYCVDQAGVARRHLSVWESGAGGAGNEPEYPYHRDLSALMDARDFRWIDESLKRNWISNGQQTAGVADDLRAAFEVARERRGLIDEYEAACWSQLKGEALAGSMHLQQRSCSWEPAIGLAGAAVYVGAENCEKFAGLQLGLFGFWSGKEFDGVQIGLLNSAQSNFNGVQLGGVNHVAGDAGGAQLGFSNIVDGVMEGAQLGIVTNSSGERLSPEYGASSIFGVQLCPFFNVAEGGASGAQIGAANIVAGRRAQLNGFSAGILNLYGDIHGASLGVFNAAPPYGILGL